MKNIICLLVVAILFGCTPNQDDYMLKSDCNDKKEVQKEMTLSELQDKVISLQKEGRRLTDRLIEYGILSNPHYVIFGHDTRIDIELMDKKIDLILKHLGLEMEYIPKETIGGNYVLKPIGESEDD